MHPEPVTQTLILEARTRAGWVDERPRLSDAQLDELMDLTRGRAPSDRVNNARIFMSHIFAQAVEDECRLYQLRTELTARLGLMGDKRKLTTALAKELDVFGTDKTPDKMPAHMTDGLRRALAGAQFLKYRLPSPSAAARRVDAIVEAAFVAGTITPDLRAMLDDLLIIVKPARDWSVQRQMVRGLAALMEAMTDACPGRSYASSDRGPTRVGEQGWFHKLCERFAQFVSEHEMVPAEIDAAHRPSLSGIVNQELKALRHEIDSRTA